MKNHVKSFSNRVYENIGRGSVIFIKGRPTDGGRKLYATTIDGWTEVRPGLKMVFLGNQIYQVVMKSGKFFGRKISYSGEDGLKGVLNLKNPGRPTLVLNHNKTPFHWITLKHLDIGSAIREVGNRLITHEMILESKSESDRDKFLKWAAREFIDYVKGIDNSIVIEKAESDAKDLTDVGMDAFYYRDDWHESSYISDEWEWDATFRIAFDMEKIQDQEIIDLGNKIADETGVYILRDPVLDMLGSYGEADTLELNCFFNSDGDFKSSGEDEVEVDGFENSLVQITITTKDHELTMESDDLPGIFEEFKDFTSDVEPGDFVRFVKQSGDEKGRSARQKEFKAFDSNKLLKQDPDSYDYSGKWISREDADKKYKEFQDTFESIKSLSDKESAEELFNYIDNLTQMPYSNNWQFRNLIDHLEKVRDIESEDSREHRDLVHTKYNVINDLRQLSYKLSGLLRDYPKVAEGRLLNYIKSNSMNSYAFKMASRYGLQGVNGEMVNLGSLIFFLTPEYLEKLGFEKPVKTNL
jgi:hypothetical protein